MKAINEIFVMQAEYSSLIKKLALLPTADSEAKLFNNRVLYNEIIAECLNWDTIAALKNFKDSKEYDVLIIRGLPSDLILPPTPYEDHDANIFNQLPISTALNLGLFQILNIHPITYHEENEGALFRHIAPKRRELDKKTSYGANIPLGMHVDNCYLPLVSEIRQGYSSCPEFLSLFGLRCDVKVATQIVLLEDVVKQLTEECITELLQANFCVKTPESFSYSEEFVLPLLVKGLDGKFYCRFDQDFVSPINDLASDALKQFIHAINNCTIPHLILQNGDFMMFKNQRVMHGRDKFTPRFDGNDRWMLRLFGVGSIHQVYPVANANFYHILAFSDRAAMVA